jgi:hypothetical protein
MIAWPAAEPLLEAVLVGAARPACSPHADPRRQALTDAFALLFSAQTVDPVDLRKVR